MVTIALHIFLTDPLGLLRDREWEGERDRNRDSRKLDILKSCSSCYHAHLLINSIVGTLFLVLSDSDFFSLIHVFFFFFLIYKVGNIGL